MPEEITLDRLHDVIQIVMGWEDCHLHLFKFGDKRFAEEPEEEWEGQEESFQRLSDLAMSAGEYFDYDYDFGDGWRHRVVVEKISKIATEYAPLTKCLGGKRRCPPEDVGGPHGFVRFLNACKNPDHPDHALILRSARSFNPGDFNPEVVNLALHKYARWSRPRGMDMDLSE